MVLDAGALTSGGKLSVKKRMFISPRKFGRDSIACERDGDAAGRHPYTELRMPNGRLNHGWRRGLPIDRPFPNAQIAKCPIAGRSLPYGYLYLRRKMKASHCSPSAADNGVDDFEASDREMTIRDNATAAREVSYIRYDNMRRWLSDCRAQCAQARAPCVPP